MQLYIFIEVEVQLALKSREEYGRMYVNPYKAAKAARKVFRQPPPSHTTAILTAKSREEA
jgi:hypothetical protein